MPIPDMQTLQLPLLEFVKDRNEHKFRDAVEHLANLFQLTKEEREQLVPSGTDQLFDNKVAWAQSQLKHAGLIERTGWGRFRITEEGTRVLEQKPQRIDNKFLMQFEGFRKFLKGGNKPPREGERETEIDMASCLKSFPSAEDEEQLDEGQKQHTEFLRRFPFREHPELIEKLRPQDIFEKGNDGTFLTWLEHKTIETVRLRVGSNAFAENARDNVDKFKELLRISVDPTKSLAEKIDASWDEISSFGADRHIAKKIIYMYNFDKMFPVLSTSHMEYFIGRFGKDFEAIAKSKSGMLYQDLSVGKKYELLTSVLRDIKNEVNPDWTSPAFMDALYKCSPPPGTIKPVPGIAKPKRLAIEDVSRITRMTDDAILEIEELLSEKKQIIFYGPPGTGKTFFAKLFAAYFTGDPSSVRLVQFHPSYSYEDFVEGIKPAISKDGVGQGFTRQWGLLRHLVKECIDNPDQKYVLIIDELNRANISKVFGELIYLLEYRDEEIALTYSPHEQFYLPSNLYFIGTMNSADRSIAFVDYALRRRFLFRDFYPDLMILREWLAENAPDMEADKVTQMLEEINRTIADKLGKEYQIGQSYFMIENLTPASLEQTIRYAVMPLIHQYFFGNKEKISQIEKIIEKNLEAIRLGGNNKAENNA